VPKYSILRKDVVEEQHQADPGDYTQIASIPRLEAVGPEIGLYDYQTAIKHIRMNVARVEADRDAFNEGLRFKLTVPGKRDVMYVIDDQALKMNDFEDDFTRWASQEIAENMTNLLKNER
jgi:hypothetical protein